MNRQNEYADRFSNPLSAYKPRPWGESLCTSMGSKPEPISKTNLPKRKPVEAIVIRRRATPLTSIHDVGHSLYSNA